MHYDTIKDSKPSDFKRLTGVSKETFAEMLSTLFASFRVFGRPPTHIIADRLLMTLMYWREYRTQFHIAQTYGVSEATVCRTIKKVENALIRSQRFHLPGKKVLSKSDVEFNIVLIDATECPVERPKKTANSTPATAARKSDTPRKRKS